MNDLLAFGLQIITWFQGLGDWLTIPFQGITFLEMRSFSCSWRPPSTGAWMQAWDCD